MSLFAYVRGKVKLTTMKRSNDLPGMTMDLGRLPLLAPT